MRALGWAAVALLLAGCAQAPPAGHAAVPPPPAAMPPVPPPLLPGLPLVPVQATQVSGGGEPVILADRLGRHLWVGDTAGVHVSSDNGTSWHDMALPLSTADLLFTDGVALAQSEDGTLYAATLSDNRADVSRSTDGTAFASASTAAGAPVDRPWIAVHGGTAVLVYLNNSGVVGSMEACSRSTDGGATFTDRNPTVGPSGSGGIVMDDAGTAYFTWKADGSLTRVAGSCASAPPFALEERKPFFDAVGVNNMIPVATNGTALHVAAAGEGNAMVLASTRSWADPPRRLTLSPATLATNTFAAVAARGRDVAVAWYGSTTPGDPSASGFSGDFNVYLARVHDPFGEEGGAAQVTVQQLTARPNHHGQICMLGLTCTGSRGLLDYFGVAFDAWGGVDVAYVDDTGSTATYAVHLPPAGWAPPAPTNSSSDAPPPTLPSSGAGAGPAASPSRPPPQVPVARFSGTVHGLVLSVDGRASTGKAPLAFRWTWGDGTESSGSAASGSHTYRANGTYTVQLRVTDADGRSAAASGSIRVAADAGGQVQAGGSTDAVTVSVPGPGLCGALAAAALAAVAARRSRRA